jgi:hypothetical protein
MRRSQVCKHQVCDYCGGRFGMLTHRWWGDKFCKRTCKNAYARENHRTLSGWVIPQREFLHLHCQPPMSRSCRAHFELAPKLSQKMGYYRATCVTRQRPRLLPD